MHQINTDSEVMKYFPNIATEEDTNAFISRMIHQYEQTNYCYFVVEKLETRDFIGFIGLSEPTYKAYFTPCIDMGWRLKRSEWHKGYASEGAIRCLSYAFEHCNINEVYAVAPKINIASVGVMQKIGMIKQNEFEHPLLANHPHLKRCVVYKSFAMPHN